MKYLWVFAVLATSAYAAEQAETVIREEDKVVYQKKTMIDFSDVLINGELMKPEGTYVKSKKTTDFEALIEMRTDFRDELVESVGSL